MFQFSAFAYYTMYLQYIRLPHSETTGSIPICGSPVFIAACRVLHRLWEPRHPPCALIYFLHRMAFCFHAAAFWPPLARRAAVAFSFSLFLFSSNMSKNFFSRSKQYALSIRLPRLWLIAYSLSLENVENNGFEPLTPCVQGRCSSQLS